MSFIEIYGIENIGVFVGGSVDIFVDVVSVVLVFVEMIGVVGV